MISQSPRKNDGRNLIKGVGFFKILTTLRIDYELSTNEKFMRRTLYDKSETGVKVKDIKIFALVETIPELSKLKKELRWKRKKAECNFYQDDKYAVYFLVNENGKNTGFYKVVKLEKILKRGIEPEKVNYYKIL